MRSSVKQAVMTSVLRSRVKALEVEVNHANGLLQTRLSSVESLRETAAKRKKTIKGLRSDLKQATRRNALLEQRLEEVAQLQQFVAAERDELHANAVRDGEAAQGRIVGLSMSLDALNADMEQARTRESQLMLSLEDLEQKIKAAHEEHRELKSTIHQCKASHEDTREKLRAQQQNNQMLQLNNGELKELIVQLESRMKAAATMLQGE